MKTSGIRHRVGSRRRRMRMDYSLRGMMAECCA